MTLSNIIAEPRREITETFMGVAWIFGLILILTVIPTAVYVVMNTAGWYAADETFSMKLKLAILFSVLGFAGIIIIGVVLMLIHWIGEEFCDFLEKKGLQVRPKQRWMRYNGEWVKVK